MKRTIIFIITALIILSSISFTSHAAYPNVNVYINGNTVTGINGYLINNTTYVAFREFFGSKKTIGADISWNQKTKTASADSDDFCIRAASGARNLLINGNTLNGNQPNRLVGGKLYIPIRAAAEAIGYDVKWNSKTRSVELTYKSVRIEDSDSTVQDPSVDNNYSEEDLYWLSRLIYAEANGQPYDGKIAVGNVVMNRVKSNDYPDSVYEVLFDRKYGTQFSPTENGSINNTPDEECVRAAKEVLNGYTLSDKILYFVNHDLSSSTWFYTRTFVFKIGDHSFYY